MKTFEFTGRKYDAHKYECVEEKNLGQMQFESVNHAELWFLENYPNYYFGGNIVQVDDVECPDFVCIPVPAYYKEFYDTDNMAYIVIKELDYLKSLNN